MPAKKKGGKKAKKEAVEDFGEFEAMRGEQLEMTLANMKEKLQGLKIHRNQLQIEKDLLHDFYSNVREEIKEHEARIVNFDTKMQQAEKTHRTQITSHMQKVKHLEYEHMNSCDQVKSDAKEDMQEERKHHTSHEKDNLKDKQFKKDEY
jgi:hypothetical protein